MGDEYMIRIGNPGLDLARMKLSHEEVVEYTENFKDTSARPKQIGKILPSWAPRWGADLGLPVGDDHTRKFEGDAMDGNSDYERALVVEALDRLVAGGKGGTIIFYRAEY